VHVLVDSFCVPISLLVADSNISDATVVKGLFNKMFITDDIFKTHCKLFLADSGYSSFAVTDYITSNLGV
jgi:hypothetical protein